LIGSSLIPNFSRPSSYFLNQVQDFERLKIQGRFKATPEIQADAGTPNEVSL